MAVVVLALVGGLAVGVAVGSRLVARRSPLATRTVTVAGAAPAPTVAGTVLRPHRGGSGTAARTPAGAVAAAYADLHALDGPAVLDATRIEAVVATLAAPQARASLLAAYARAAADVRRRLGVGTLPAPVVIVRAVPVGYRLESWSPSAATVSIWRVGIVGSGASVSPQQSWRTETFQLLWEGGAWKVASLVSTPGPTPPLPAAVAPTPATELFAAIPHFRDRTNGR